MAYSTQQKLMVAVTVFVIGILLAVEAAPSSGRCTYTAEDWEDIIHSMCGRRNKRSTGTTLTSAVQGKIIKNTLFIDYGSIVYSMFMRYLLIYAHAHCTLHSQKKCLSVLPFGYLAMRLES